TGGSSDSERPPVPPSRPVGQWRPARKLLSSQRRDRPGIAPAFPIRSPFAGIYHRGVTASRTLTSWLPVLLWAALIFALSSIPSLGTGLGGWDLVFRKCAHVTEYAILGLLLARALGREAPALLLGVVYAASDELHQAFVRGRHASPVDVAIDMLGLLIGVAVWRRQSSA